VITIRTAPFGAAVAPTEIAVTPALLTLTLCAPTVPSVQEKRKSPAASVSVSSAVTLPPPLVTARETARSASG
jgi:hypothetical protein